MYVLDRSQSARKQRIPRALAAFTAFTVLITGLEAAQPASAAPTADPAPTAAKVASRPDIVSAALTARSQGSRVEVESMRSETDTTWANPDGTMTTEAHAVPVRFKTKAGSWRSIDLNLAKAADGSVAPKGHKLGLRLGKRTTGAGGVFAAAGGTVEWLAPFRLPEPSIDGTKATYAEVQPGVDLTIDARRNGFETDFVVKSRPATAPVWRIPLKTNGLTARTLKDGTIEFVDAKNVVRSKIPVSLMWDAAKDEASGEPVDKTVVKVTVEQKSRTAATLVIAPDAKWFLDPARTFPVTVDPTYVTGTLKSTFDTWVQSGVTTDQSEAVDLRVGKNGAETARSFMNFATSTFAGKDILSASMSIWQYGAVSCTPTVVQLRSATPATTATRWTAQPTIGAVYGSVSAAKGASGCAGGRISIPMTGLAQAWSTAPYPTGGLALTAANEADVNSWKRFYAFSGVADPYVTMTWNRQPATPAPIEATEAVAYAAPGATTSALYSPNLRPWVRTKATDPDGNTVKYIFEFYTGSGSTFSLKGTCTSSVYASGSTAGCKPSADLPDNTLLSVRAKANDGRLDGGWTPPITLRTAAALPAQPSISCPAPYGNGTWQDDAPTADVTCTISAPGSGYTAPGYLRSFIDGKRPTTNYTGGAEGQIKITPSTDPAVAKWDVTFPRDKAGLHTIVVQAESPSGKFSTPNKTYTLGWGGTAMTAPTTNPRITTADNVRVTASGPPKGTASSVTAKVKWRVSGYGGSDDLVGWNDSTDLPVTDNGAAGVTVNALWDSNQATTDANLDSDPDTAGVQPTTLNSRVPVKLDLQVCFKYGTSEQCTWSQTPDTTIQRLPHAFGDGFPTSEAGPGQVALWTGEFNMSTTDISVPGYTGDLSISRSLMTYESPNNGVTGAFGPGWTAQFDGADAGAAGMQVIDSTRRDGTLVLTDGDGTSSVYESPSGKRRTDGTFEVGTWVPADEETEADGSQLKVTGSGASTTVSYVEDDGTVTTWNTPAAPVKNADTLFRADGVSEPGVAGKTSFSYDSAHRVVRILAPAAPGVTCGTYNASAPLTGLNPGCRALHFVYTVIGSSRWRLSEGWLDIYNPAKAGGAGMESIKVAAYTYNTNADLIKATDPRSGLSTEYSYNAAGDLATVKQPGQVPFQLNYVTVEGRPKLDSVTRDRPAGDPAGGTATLGKYVYEVPLSGDGLPDLTAGSVGRWNQKSVPTNGVAVFGPDHPISGAPAAADWQYADLQYTDAAGYTVNTAKYGAGDWQYTATDYNEGGNVVRELDERALQVIIGGQLPAGATADQLATLTVYNSEVKNAAGDAVLTPAGALVTDTFGPSRYASLKDGTVAWVRPHTRTTFDQGAPNAGINPNTSLPYRLATKETAFAHDPGSGTDLEITSQSLTDYSAPVSGDADGWALSQPGKTIDDVDLDGVLSTGDIVKTTRYDPEGRVTETRQPASNGADAGTTKTVYYSTAANPAATECGGKPQWAGLVCKTFIAAQPTGGSGTLPSNATTGYNYLLMPTTVVQISGTTTRTNTTTYLADGRMATTKITAANLGDSTPVTEKTSDYDAATGLVTTVSAKNADGSVAGSVTRAYDGWGRQVSYQPSGETASSTVYDPAGSVAKVIDANGSTTYTYDGTDANGNQERRGLVTKIDTTTAGVTWSANGAYDSDGSLTIQKLPGGVTQYHDIDTAGEPLGLRYTGQVTNLNDDGSTTVDPNGPWLSWSLVNDVSGRITREWTPDGAGFTTSTGGALPYDRQYSYDGAGRLARVDDRTAAASGTDVSDPAEAPGCVTRSYSFDRNSNRVAKAVAAPAADGGCTTSGAAVVTRSFDSADRPVTGANGTGSYVYDALGRTTKLPSSDASHPADGDITLGYYDNDLARTIAQGGTTTTFTLDAVDRRSTETVTSGGVTTQTVRHYTDPSDNPAWVTQGSTVQRYLELLGDDLSLTADQTGAADLTLSDPHGDVVTTVDLATAGATATSISGWNNYDEFGGAVSRTAGTGLLDYGWLGAKQRAGTSAGLLLLGARLYNSATGLFTSMDPVVGGNANAYTYPADPVNDVDLDGRFKWKKFFGGVAKWSGKVSTWAGYCPLPFCASISAAAGILSTVSYLAAGDRRAAARQALSTVVGLALGGAKLGKVAYKFRKAGKLKRKYRGVRKFVAGGGFFGAFDRAAKGAGRGKWYRRYWGAKAHGVQVGAGWAIDNYHFRRPRRDRRIRDY